METIDGGRTLSFATGLNNALSHLAWYFGGDRGSAMAQALTTNDPHVAVRQLGIKEDYTAIDGDRRRPRYLLQRSGGEALGPKFDIRDFHEAVLSQGTLPLAVLEEQVNRYIAASKAN